MKNLILLSFAILFFSCERGDDCHPQQSESLKASYYGTHDDCGRVMLQFDASDSAKLQSITGRRGMICITDQLPMGMNMPGEKMFVTIGRMNTMQSGMCRGQQEYPSCRVFSSYPRE